MEQRALLSVTVLGEAFKSVEFRAPGRLTGDMLVSGTPWDLQGVGNLAGRMTYDSYDHGAIGDRGASISGRGTWSVDILSGTWDLGGHFGTTEDQNAALNGSATVDHSRVRAPIAVDFRGEYAVSDSVFDTSDFSLDLKLTAPDRSWAFKGTLRPTAKKPFDIVVTPSWTDGGVNVAVTVPGRVHKVPTHSTPVTHIDVYWARGQKLLSALDDRIPVYWNEASGAYTITDLPPAPAEATGLAFVAKFDGKTKTASLPLLSIANATVAEGDGSDPQNENQAVFPVVLAQPYAQHVTLRYTTVGGTAKPGIDFRPTTGSVVILAGETRGEIKVPIIGNTAFERDKTFSVRLANAENIPLDKDRAKAVGTITDDDSPPTISIADATAVDPAGRTGRAVFAVTLANPSYQTVMVRYTTRDGSAKAGEDYTGTSGTLTFAPGTITRTITVPVKADRDAETDDFFVDLSAPVNATIADGEGTGTILPPSLYVADTTVAEGHGSDPQNENQAVFPVVLAQPYAQHVTLWYTTVGGSAKPGVDFRPTTGLVVIMAGETRGEIKVPILGDTAFERDKTFSVTLTKAENIPLDKEYARAVATITDDDLRPTISIADASIVEPAEGTAKMVFTAILSNPSCETVSVTYGTRDGSAKADEDYLATAGTLKFAPGQTTATIAVPVKADRETQSEEFFVDLSGPVNATIADGQGLGTISLPELSVADTGIAEGDGSDPQNPNQAVFSVVLSQSSTEPVTVWYTTVQGSAKPEVDFQPTSGSIVIPAGETRGPIEVPIIGNTKYEPDKTFSVALTKAENVALDENYASGVCVIANDDPQPTMSIADASVVEPADGTAQMVFTVTLSNPSYRTVEVKYKTGDYTGTAGEDYVAASGTLTFAPGETIGTISVLVKADQDVDDEDFFVNLFAPVDATIADLEATGKILEIPGPNTDLARSRDAAMAQWAAAEGASDLEQLRD